MINNNKYMGFVMRSKSNAIVCVYNPTAKDTEKDKRYTLFNMSNIDKETVYTKMGWGKLRTRQTEDLTPKEHLIIRKCEYFAEQENQRLWQAYMIKGKEEQDGQR